jgi:hypothetical protein
MGLILNTPATIEMIAKCNSLFGSGSLSWWRQQPQRGWFTGTTTKKKLHDIAKAINFYPSNGAGSPEGKNWIKWLKQLDGGPVPTPADRLIECIAEALNDTDCVEVIFVVTFTTSQYATVSCAQLGPANGYSKVITVDTPSVQTMKRQVRRRKAARVKSRRKKS